MARKASATEARNTRDYKVTDNVVFENARIIYRNFSGREQKFNEEGKRNFCVVIDDDEKAQELSESGWGVKIHQPRDEDDDPFYYLPVAVSYKYKPPRVYMLTKRNRTKLDEDSISSLDDVDILSTDLIVRPYNWNIGSNSGVKAYLKSMYVLIDEDVLASKYAEWDQPDDEVDPDDLPF